MSQLSCPSFDRFPRPVCEENFSLARPNHVTLKIDVPHTDHSHVIGRGGRNIKAVMFDTQCHIHFPDANRINLIEKSNQVSISGHINKVETARKRIRDMLPISFSFALPSNQPCEHQIHRNSAFVKQLECEYSVEIVYRRPLADAAGSAMVSVKGLAVNYRNTKNAVQLLLMQYYGKSKHHIVPIKMSIELDPTNESIFSGRRFPDDLNNLIAQATGATMKYKSSCLLSKLEDRLFECSEKWPIVNLETILNARCCAIEIVGHNVEGVFLARQLITNLLPVTLTFDVSTLDCKWLQCYDFNRLRELCDVSMQVRSKPKHFSKCLTLKTIEKNVRALYTAWYSIQEFLYNMKQINAQLPLFPDVTCRNDTKEQQTICCIEQPNNSFEATVSHSLLGHGNCQHMGNNEHSQSFTDSMAAVSGLSEQIGFANNAQLNLTMMPRAITKTEPPLQEFHINGQPLKWGGVWNNGSEEPRQTTMQRSFVQYSPPPRMRRAAFGAISNPNTAESTVRQ